MGRRDDWAQRERRERHPAVDSFLEVLPPEVRRLAQELRGLVHAHAAGPSEAIDYRTPFFFLEGPFCHLSPTRRRVVLGFVDATGIHDGTGFPRGTGTSSIRRAAFTPGQTLPRRAIASWIRQAAARSGARRAADP